MFTVEKVPTKYILPAHVYPIFKSLKSETPHAIRCLVAYQGGQYRFRLYSVTRKTRT